MPRQVTAKLTDAVDKHVLGILKENEKRIKEINTPFNPIKGEGCGDKRFLLFLPDFPIQRQQLPVSMKKIPLVKMLIEFGSCKAVIEELHKDIDEPYDLEEEIEQLVEQFTRIRMKHDPFFFFATFIYIKPKVEVSPSVLCSEDRSEDCSGGWRSEERRIALSVSFC